MAGTAAFVVAGIGGGLTDLGAWYEGLVFPAWKPPDAAFPIAWTTIFILAAVAAVLAWRGTPTAGGRALLVGLFALNSALNIGWSWLFFTLKRPDWALVEVVPLWLSILALVIVCGRADRRAGWALAPYLVWVGFAAVLNAFIAQANGPF